MSVGSANDFRAGTAEADGKDIASTSGMAGVLLAVFPLLLLFDTRLAWVALGTAIVLLCSKHLSTDRRPSRRGAENDASI